MANRITNKQLEAVCEMINRATGSPLAPYVRNEDGQYKAQVGCYLIDAAYGGVNLARIVNNGGGQTCPLGLGFRTKRELFDQMHAFLRGIEAAQPEKRG